MNEKNILARVLRKNQTSQELKIWNILRNKQIKNYKFRRQYPIGNYIVDFVCLSKQLIIEVDGKYHDTAEQQQLDKQRENRLQKLGFTVLRFNNEEVVACPEEVIEKIKQYIV